MQHINILNGLDILSLIYKIILFNKLILNVSFPIKKLSLYYFKNCQKFNEKEKILLMNYFL